MKVSNYPSLIILLVFLFVSATHIQASGGSQPDSGIEPPPDISPEALALHQQELQETLELMAKIAAPDEPEPDAEEYAPGPEPADNPADEDTP